MYVSLSVLVLRVCLSMLVHMRARLCVVRFFCPPFPFFRKLTLAVWHYLSLFGLLFAGGFLDFVAVVAFSGGSVHEQIFKACKKKYDPDDSGSIDLVNFVASIKAAVMAVS